MGLIHTETSLYDISQDFNLRCDCAYFINMQKFITLVPKISVTKKIADITTGISNGVNLEADTYSLIPTNNIYISVMEFSNGFPVVFNSEGEFFGSITFLQDSVIENNGELFNRGIIQKDEIIIARSGGIGKVAWFGDIMDDYPDLNFIASGFTTKVKLKEGFEPRFVNIWLNQLFIKYYLLAKSSGKCQRNISQEYIYDIPFPDISFEQQVKLADKYYNEIKEFEKSILDLDTSTDIVNECLQIVLGINFDFPTNKGLIHSENSLMNIANNYSLRCDAKQNQDYYRYILNILDSIDTIKLGDMIDGPFIKGRQPRYLNDDESYGIPVISTLAIQDLTINKDACKKIDTNDFEEMEDLLKPVNGDILVTLDGAVSVGKVAYFSLDDDYAIDSHIGIIRLQQNFDRELVALLLASELCQAQFRLYETGTGSKTINEIDLRNILIPELKDEQIRKFKEIYLKRKTDILKRLESVNDDREELYKSFLQDMIK